MTEASVETGFDCVLDNNNTRSYAFKSLSSSNGVIVSGANLFHCFASNWPYF